MYFTFTTSRSNIQEGINPSSLSYIVLCSYVLVDYHVVFHRPKHITGTITSNLCRFICYINT